MRGLLTIAFAGFACLIGNVAFGQGLICQLPADGTWVRYEGTYSQIEFRPETVAGKIEIEPWKEHLTVKSVGSETAQYRGEDVPCRWIEIKIERGRVKDGKIDTGLAGLNIYKILVPETAVITDNVDANGVPVSFVPVVKGYRKIGKSNPKELVEPALQLYPLAILVGYYRELQVVAEDVDPEVGIGAIKANQLKGELTIERPNSRTVIDSTIWKSPEIAFGVAKWTSKTTRQIKDAKARRDDFKSVTEVTSEMIAQETGTDAQSELSVP